MGLGEATIVQAGDLGKGWGWGWERIKVTALV